MYIYNKEKKSYFKGNAGAAVLCGTAGGGDYSDLYQIIFNYDGEIWAFYIHAGLINSKNFDINNNKEKNEIFPAFLIVKNELLSVDGLIKIHFLSKCGILSDDIINLGFNEIINCLVKELIDIIKSAHSQFRCIIEVVDDYISEKETLEIFKNSYMKLQGENGI